MLLHSREIILASGSPRRREMMERMGFKVHVRPSDIPEIPDENEGPMAYTRRLCEEKARSVSSNLDSDLWVLAADTVVVQDEKILEKPGDFEHAVSMLKLLSGRWHEVITSFCWNRADVLKVESVTTRVKFWDLDAKTIADYVHSGEPMDKAGAYGIQGLGGLLVEEIEGSFHSVVGLPISHVVRMLNALESETK